VTGGVLVKVTDSNLVLVVVLVAVVAAVVVVAVELI